MFFLAKILDHRLYIIAVMRFQFNYESALLHIIYFVHKYGLKHYSLSLDLRLHYLIPCSHRSLGTIRNAQVKHSLFDSIEDATSLHCLSLGVCIA